MQGAQGRCVADISPEICRVTLGHLVYRSCVVPPPSPHAFANEVLGAGVLMLLDSPNCGAQCSSPSFLRYPLSNAAHSQYSVIGLQDLSVQLRARAGNQPADGTCYLVPRGSRAGRLQYLVTASHGCGSQFVLFSFIVWGWIYAGTYLRICESYAGPWGTCFTA